MESEAVTSTPALNESVRLLHQLTWAPGRTMHPTWWDQLELTQWRLPYAEYPHLRRPIDAMIAARYGVPHAPLVTPLNLQQQALIALGARMRRAIAALGVLALNTADYLLLRCYRTTLVTLLGDALCGRILAAIPVSESRACIPAEQILDVALQAGIVTLDAELTTCAVWRALRPTLPAYGSPIEYPLRQFGSGQRSALNFALRLESACRVSA
jgi:hypothetical protein